MNLFKIKTADRKWYEIILWWELRRIPYNVIMYFVGLLSFYICYVTIPLIYLLIGLGLNVIYTLFWMIELLAIKGKNNDRIKMNYPKYAFLAYFIFSVILVFGFALYLML